jgi:hypothetical protein
MTGRLLFSVFGVLGLLAGCGGGNGRSDASQEAGGGDATVDGGGSCTTLVPGGAPTVASTMMPMSALTEVPAGGTITNGTFFRTSQTLYVVPSCTVLLGVPTATAFRITSTSASAGVMDIATAATAGGEQHLATLSWSYTTAGTTMTHTVLCYTLDGATPDGGTPPGEVTASAYTATPTEIRFYTPLGSPTDGGSSCGTEVVVLQKQ